MNNVSSAGTDSLAELRKECGYSETEDCSIDSLIDYKNGLEEIASNRQSRIEALESKLDLIASGVPCVDQWRSAAAFMEFVAEVLDGAGIKRPAHYGNETAR